MWNGAGGYNIEITEATGATDGLGSPQPVTLPTEPQFSHLQNGSDASQPTILLSRYKLLSSELWSTPTPQATDLNALRSLLGGDLVGHTGQQGDSSLMKRKRASLAMSWRSQCGTWNSVTSVYSQVTPRPILGLLSQSPGWL